MPLHRKIIYQKLRTEVNELIGANVGPPDASGVRGVKANKSSVWVDKMGNIVSSSEVNSKNHMNYTQFTWHHMEDLVKVKDSAGKIRYFSTMRLMRTDVHRPQHAGSPQLAVKFNIWRSKRKRK